jgi:hypothetical protein
MRAALATDSTLLGLLVDRIHVPVGRALVEHWHLPPELVAAVSDYGDLSRVGTGLADDVDVVRMADFVYHERAGPADADWSRVAAVKAVGIAPHEADAPLRHARARAAKRRILPLH